ncbi:MAG: hypothetical protein P8Z35_09815 [Ignavibacteriaceae bacterium]
MKNISLFLFTLIIAAVIMVGCNTEESPDNPVSGQSNDIVKLNKPTSELQKELALARSATAKYHRLEVAMDDGYDTPGPVVQNMGYHYINPDNIGDTFDPGKPAILVYSKNPVNGKMRLVAVEYAVPDNNPIPQGFTGDADVWEDNTDVHLWLCHAWVWYNNPDGIFNETNPRVHVEESEVNYP